MDIIISAIICTRNRQHLVEKAVKSLLEQTLAKDLYEILVVDNNSEDRTFEIVKKISAEEKNIKYLFEKNLGLSFARNTGWRNAKGEYAAFLDDDAIASPQWLEKIVSGFRNLDDNIGEVGGKVEPIWEIPPPEWLTNKMKRQLAIVDWFESPGILNENQWLAGVNVAYRKVLLEKFNGFNTELGRRGKKLLSMEELFLKDQFRKEGIKSYYDPEIKVSHFIPKERLTPGWFFERNYWQGISEAIYIVINEKLDDATRLNLASLYAKENFTHTAWLSNLIINSLHTDDPSVIEKKCFAFRKIGYLFGLLRGE